MRLTPFNGILGASIAGHFAFLWLLGFSFGQAVRPGIYQPLLFLGDVSIRGLDALRPYKTLSLSRIGHGLAARDLDIRDEAYAPNASSGFYRPGLVVGEYARKTHLQAPKVSGVKPQLNESVLTLHPLLPYQFELYFKDRQEVHIELEFFITATGRRNFISIRRKVSSGNLEADLLSMRYIGHYMFLQQARFMPQSWQTVKIEFSPNAP